MATLKAPTERCWADVCLEDGENASRASLFIRFVADTHCRRHGRITPAAIHISSSLFLALSGAVGRQGPMARGLSAMTVPRPTADRTGVRDYISV